MISELSSTGPRIYGAESELGIMLLKDGRHNPGLASYVMKAYGEVHEQFDEDGQRHYVDHDHPEVATAEDTSIIDAAHRVLTSYLPESSRYQNLARRLNEGFRPQRTLASFDPTIIKPEHVRLYNNVMSEDGESWGFHLNFSARRTLDENDFIGTLATHNAARVIWAGAGAVFPHRQTDYRFELSEKASFMYAIANGNTQRNRPLVNTRDEPLAWADVYRRIHDISAVPVFNPRTLAIAFASSSILLSALEIGVRFDDVSIRLPVHAIRQFSADPSLRRKVEIAGSGQYLTAAEIELSLAERAMAELDDRGLLTEEQAHWGSLWIEYVDALKQDPKNAPRQLMLDYALVRERIERVVKGMPKERRYSAAWLAKLNYHQLDEKGLGMKLLLNGHFPDAPSPDALRRGMPAPQHTRAGERARMIRRIEEKGLKSSRAWDIIYASDGRIGGSYRLPDPIANPRSVTDFNARWAS